MTIADNEEISSPVKHKKHKKHKKHRHRHDREHDNHEHHHHRHHDHKHHDRSKTKDEHQTLANKKSPRLTQEQIEEFQSVFEMFDKDGDGRITTQELNTSSRNSSQSNGTIELDEFFVMMEKELKRTETEEDLRDAFKVFDRNGDELISMNELRHILDELGEDLSDEEIKDMMSEADIDGDGYVNYEGMNVVLSSSMGIILQIYL
ncbi:hypothetical protein KUTeg_013223 [Tegillarca granosa]|uniref:EF-hand domain-containing protein n=1 Tax=Tegillarca granosa TaxID=220873 RepID=A0ABQ9ET23_TEGGR|nr:hypothetical protein KUTeg_013223 [Tegillarca granosa]